MPTFLTKHNTWGGVSEIRFSPSFEVNGSYNAIDGKQLLEHGNFQLGGWSWDNQAKELYKQAPYNTDTIQGNPKALVEEADQKVNRLLGEYLLFLQFVRVRDKSAK